MSLFLLDTDTISLLERGHVAVSMKVLAQPAKVLGVTVISVEEQLSGWYTLLRQTGDPATLSRAYDRLAECVLFLSQFRIESFSEPAIARFELLKAGKLGVKAMAFALPRSPSKPMRSWSLGISETSA